VDWPRCPLLLEVNGIHDCHPNLVNVPRGGPISAALPLARGHLRLPQENLKLSAIHV
jgi:hypothetical protein